MKQIVTTKQERYVELHWFDFTKVVLVEDTNILLKLELLGAESPVTFTCEILENSKADLKIYLSTECMEPNEKKHQRAVDRMRVFKFHARNKQRYFGDEEVCYMMMQSTMGCTLRV